jgi:hypothetical protein
VAPLPFSTTNSVDHNNNNLVSTTSSSNSNNSTKLRSLLNYDILTPINTENLLNSNDNLKNTVNLNNIKRSIDSDSDENKMNKFDNSNCENRNKKQKLDDILNTGVVKNNVE